MPSEVVVLQVIKKAGYPDWKVLAQTIWSELIPDSDGEIRRDKIAAWLKYSLGVPDEQCREVVTALVEMGMFDITNGQYLKINSKLR